VRNFFIIRQRYVSKLDRPWLETPFLFQGFELKNQADIDAVQQHCDYVLNRLYQMGLIQHTVAAV